MVLGIDASRANTTMRTGVEQYAFHIIKALAEQMPAAHVRLYTASPPLSQWGTLPPTWQWVVLPGRALWSQWILPQHLRSHSVDCLFIPASRIPPITGHRVVATIHDIAFETHPAVYSLGQRLWQRWVLRDILRRADAIIVPTNSVANDIAHRYPQWYSKVNVVAHGPTVAVATETVPKIPATFLYVGRMEKKKNILPFIQAIERLAHQGGMDILRCTFVGNAGYGFGALWDAIQRCPRHLTWRGWVNEFELQQLRQTSQFMALPSIAEGFGFPVLEAWSNGCVPVVSDCGALVEVAGDAAIVLPLGSPEQWVDVLKNALPPGEHNIVDRGKRRLAQFQWDRAAERTAAVLKKLL
ncbi:glycosyltransferase family 4 protein [Candidatus Uhrbacteria bacterium]|nr:glycosyltransferase family 4 protein [Candidatus Uhrbacteria bacterium]